MQKIRHMTAFGRSCEDHSWRFIHTEQINDSMQSRFMMTVGSIASRAGINFENIVIYEMFEQDHTAFPMVPIAKEDEQEQDEEDRISAEKQKDRLLSVLEMNDLDDHNGETLEVLAIAPTGVRVRYSTIRDYTGDEVIGEACGEILGKIIENKEDHYGYVLQIQFLRDGKKYTF